MTMVQNVDQKSGQWGVKKKFRILNKDSHIMEGPIKSSSHEKLQGFLLSRSRSKGHLRKWGVSDSRCVCVFGVGAHTIGPIVTKLGTNLQQHPGQVTDW